MKSIKSADEQKPSLGTNFVSFIGPIFLAVGIPLIAFYVLYLGFIFLRDSNAPRTIIALVAILWGVGGVAILYWVFNNIVERLPGPWRTRLLPFVFVGPAIAILSWYLAIPTLRTFWISLFNRDGPPKGLNTIQQLTSDSFTSVWRIIWQFLLKV